MGDKPCAPMDTLSMGFYYGSGAPPPPEEDKGSIKDALLVTVAVLRLLAIPLGVLVAGVAGIVTLFFLFSASPYAGFGAIGAVVAAVAGLALWEWLHPPRLKE